MDNRNLIAEVPRDRYTKAPNNKVGDWCKTSLHSSSERFCVATGMSIQLTWKSATLGLGARPYMETAIAAHTHSAQTTSAKRTTRLIFRTAGLHEAN